jgi:2-oxoglutarate ferredoxin oxidoreductase subunit gamma
MSKPPLNMLLAGFGGQGILFAGKLIAYAGLIEGRELSWLPSYGPEMRGGTANCSVVISDEEIGSPISKNPTAVIAMNRPSLDKYEEAVVKGGVLVINTSMVDRDALRTDIKVVLVPANDIAEKIGDKRMTNMVLIGALLAALPFMPVSAIEKALQEHLPARHHKLLPQNYEALRQGAALVK